MTSHDEPVFSEIIVRPVTAIEESRYKSQMAEHHYLGYLPKIGETIWYVATWRDRWLAQISLSSAALKCAVRDRWIGWDFHNQFDRLKLIANNSRFLILPEGRHPNVGSCILGRLERRVISDWLQRFGHPLLLLETFVDPSRFYGGVYRASNWFELGYTQGFRRLRDGYNNTPRDPKLVFVRPLCRAVQARLTQSSLIDLGLTGVPRMQIAASQMRSLPDYFRDIPDPRRPQGRRHRLHVVLGLAVGACLCGMKGYKAIAQWADLLGVAARRRFGCRFYKGSYIVPSCSVIRDCLVRVDPDKLDEALSAWALDQLSPNEALALDGKTMKGAVDDQGAKTHILSLVGHHSRQCIAQKKLVL